MFWMAIGAIAGGLISSRAQKKAQAREMAYHDKVRREQDAREDTKIQRMTKDAESAGLNPVTALRSGAFGMVGYQAPVFSSFSNSGGMGDAVARAFSALDNIPTQQQKLRESMEMELLGAQIKNINQQTSYYSGLGRTPQANVTGFFHDGGGELSSAPGYITRGSWVTDKDAARLAAGQSINPELGRGRATNPYSTASNRKIDRRYSNTEMWEERYGDILGGIVGGIYTAWADSEINNPAFSRYVNEYSQRKEHSRIYQQIKKSYKRDAWHPPLHPLLKR